MPQIRRSVLAEQDFGAIWDFIASENKRAADQLLLRIERKLQLYALHPGMGADRSSLSVGLRSFPVGRYVVFYRAVSGGIELVRIVHGARNFQRLFGGD